MFRLKILVMAINPVGSTNLLSKYISAQNAASPALPAISAANASLPGVSASVTPRTKEQDLIEKQKRLIKLQNDKINSLQTQKTQKPQSSSQGIVGTVLSIIGGITLVNFLFNYRSPAKMRAEMQQAAQQMQEVIEASMRRAAQIANEADGDIAIKPKEKPKKIMQAIFDSMGKVVGKKIIDNENNRILKVIEYYPGTKKPATIEAYDYVNKRINYNWFRENGTKAMEEIFDLKTRKKIATFFYEEDGKTVSKVKRS